MIPVRLPGKKANKYGAKKVSVDGILFASGAEARRYGQLAMMQKAGIIKDLIVQPMFSFELNGVKICRYIADFSYRDSATGGLIVCDVKGVLTREYVIKKKMMQAFHGIKVHEVKARTLR